jgi:periplasmic copper chaperone A
MKRALLLLLVACGPGSEVKTGRELYLAYGCAACHGENADGRGFSAPLSTFKPRDLRDVSRFTGAKTAEGIAATIAFGIADGRTGMPAYPDIPKRERLAMAEYILSLEPPATRIWARASHPMQSIAAAYVVSLPAAITAVTTPAARIVELHEMKTVNGVMSMNKVERIAAPPAEGAHLMLIDLVKPLKAGDVIALTLTFEDGSRETIEAPVRDEE